MGHSYKPRRRSQTQPLRPAFHIVCDDSKMAPRYWNAVGQLVRDHVTIRAWAKGSLQPADIVTFAEGLQKGEDIRVWVLLDREFAGHQRKAADQAAVRAEGSSLTVLLSSPCFEVWLLAHFEPLGRVFSDNGQVLGAYEGAYQKAFGIAAAERKSQTDFTKFNVKHLTVATAHAKKGNQPETTDQTESVAGCWTKIWQLGAAILNLVGEPDNADASG